jgi:hypothetical protein
MARNTGDLQTYVIELKLYAPREHHEAMEQILKQYARDMLASAMLLSPDRQPMIAARTSDAFYDTNEIEILDPSDNIHG